MPDRGPRNRAALIRAIIPRPSADIAPMRAAFARTVSIWMADTALLMQMIDDWVDQDEECGARLTPVITGYLTLESVAELYEKTIRDLTVLLNASGIQNPVLKGLVVDLYKDYLHAAIDAVYSGLAA